MSISRKIVITERENLGSVVGTRLPIRNVFQVGPTTSSVGITTVSSLQQSQARSLTKKLVVSTTSNVTALPTISETYEFTNTDYRTATDTTNAPQQSWSAYVSASLSTNIDSDHFTTIDAFYDVNDALSLGITDSTHTANVNYEYNFLIENFENAISSPAYSERILPNMYVIMYAKMAKEVGSQKAIFDDFITLSGTINATQIYPLQNKVFTNLNPSGEYHDLFAQKLIDIQNGVVRVDTTALQAVMANIVIPPEQLSAINDLSAMKEMYPMYNEINLTMDKFSSFSTILRDSNLTLSLINYVINNSMNTKNLLYSEQTLSYASDNTISTNTSIENRTLPVIDILDWWNKTKTDFTPNETNNTNTLVLGIDDETIKIAQKEYAFARTLSYIIFYGKLRKIVQQTQRNFQQIVDGEPAYSETVFYRIDKFKTGSTIPLQTFWVPNSAKMDAIQLIDTQVKYNVGYDYQISSYNIVIGSSIATTNEAMNTTDLSSTTTLKYTTTPKISLIQIPVYSISNKIIDDPPLSPEILTIPMKNVNNKIKFYFNNSTGEEQTTFISIEPNDNRNIKITNTMFTTLITDKTTFKSDDIASAFEIYRIATKPTSYSQFSNNLLATVTTDYDKATLTKASSASYEDTIKPNTKYYYVFRSIDFHGHISNPTDVYEIEMVDDDGSIYLRKNIVNIKDLKLNKKDTKIFKKLFYIKPQILQSIINAATLQKNNITNSHDIFTLGSPNILGVAASPVWNKKFKLRFVSKKTGKMFDLNIQLEVENDKENL
jgi:hypothetical protein